MRGDLYNFDMYDEIKPRLDGNRKIPGDDDDVGGTIRWAVWDRKELEAAGWTPKSRPYNWCEEFSRQTSGPGQWFWDYPNVTWGRTRVLVSQYGSLDV